MADVEIQQGDDWVVVRVQGKKEELSSGHSISVHDWIRILQHFGISVDRKWGTFVNDNEDDFRTEE